MFVEVKDLESFEKPSQYQDMPSLNNYPLQMFYKPHKKLAYINLSLWFFKY